MSIVAPRPIGWISTCDADGTPNLAPYSFFNLLRARPPLLGFCSGGEKDSLRNVRGNGHFVWNLASRDLAAAMVASSAEVARDVDEFALTGLSAAPSTLPGVPYVAEAVASFDCKVTQIVPLIDRDGAPSGTTLVVGQVLYVRIAHRVIENGTYNMLRANPVMRGGGTGDYFGISPNDLFVIERPG